MDETLPIQFTVTDICGMSQHRDEQFVVVHIADRKVISQTSKRTYTEAALERRDCLPHLTEGSEIQIYRVTREV
jgi:hypothetical protein